MQPVCVLPRGARQEIDVTTFSTAIASCLPIDSHFPVAIGVRVENEVHHVVG